MRDLVKRFFYVSGLDRLSGVAKCPGCHGSEGDREHINHEDLDPFSSILFFQKDTESLGRTSTKLICAVQYLRDVDHGK